MPPLLYVLKPEDRLGKGFVTAALWRITDEKLAVDQSDYAGYRRAVALRDARDIGGEG